ncbi:hypothetical protein AURDEDRAFT_175524 [Auricularia subglabra TFB-10046 SS5]|uniref:Uncharacterized protein n=1 Tax=Auricularia subglabra (strain TFB-10046 / SS5) TaxID=717982 RepID=J0WRR8_AURST|nr:hypothetical protein AURDEDRAFT_175524 [Auricularia subglabra TFB-10046 SS5]
MDHCFDVPFQQLRPMFPSLQRFYRGAHKLFRKAAWGCSRIRMSHARRLSVGTQSACIRRCSVQVATDVTTSCLQKTQQSAAVGLREDEPDVAGLRRPSRRPA